MRNLRRLVALVFGLAIPIMLYGAQSVSTHREKPSPNFPRLFPKPTGQNGYEEFVMAADLAEASPVWRSFEAVYFTKPGPTLALKRNVLADQTVQQALSLVRAGLRKRIRSPHDHPSLYSVLPEIAVFRDIGRMLGAEIDVLFADGRSSQALDTLHDALAFGRQVQVTARGVVGLLIEHTALYRFADHLDQLSLQDCERLIQLAKEQGQQPDPLIGILSQEKAMYLQTLKENRSDANALLSMAASVPHTSIADQRDIEDLQRRVKTEPNWGAALLGQAAARVGTHFDLTLAELRQPIWKRKYPVLNEDGSPEARLLHVICPPSYSRLGDRFAHELALVKILGTHAAVLRSRRQHHHLPENLEELKLGNLAIDPFTGKSFAYMRLSDQAYEITSVGFFDPGDAKHPPSGQRVPITISFPPQPQP